MAIGAITMILTNVGLQIYNNWCGSRQNAKLQQKREEFERAARDRNTEHMWKLLREGQELTMQLEKEKHDDRLRELRKEADYLLQRRIHEDTIRNWPLRVLPIVMMNRRFGNLLANQEENVVMHVILTRSNYDKFNTLVYPVIEKQLEQYCDKHWSTMSDHPVLFYSGAWKSMTSPTTPQIDAMRGELTNLPTLLITPFFRPCDGKLVFRLNMWGVGPNSTDRFDVPEIEPKSDEFHFQRTYTNEQDYDKEIGLLEEIVEDLVPYLECMIGYMADTYFWASSGLAPHLPLLITNGTINTDGMKYLISDSREYYDQLLLTSEEKAKENPFMQENLLNLYEGSAELWDDTTRKKNLGNIISKYNGRSIGDERIPFKSVLSGKNYRSYDLPFLLHVKKLSSLLSVDTKALLNEEIERLGHNAPKTFSRDSFPNYLLREYHVQELDVEDVLRSFEKYCNDFEIKDSSILMCRINLNEYHFHTYDDEKDVILCYDEPFNKCYKTQSVRHQRNINSLFSNNKIKQISCRLPRIGYLIEKINTTSLSY